MPYIAPISPIIGSGDSQSIYAATTAQLLAISRGAAANPDATLGPLLKVERLINIAESAVAGDGGEQLAAILGIGVGTAACEVQPVGVYGGAKTSSTAAGGTAGGNDACGVYGVGRITGSGTGVGIGAFFNGRRDTATGKLTGVEVSADNNVASADTYTPSAFNATNGIWLHANGLARAAVGLAIGNPFNVQFDVGIGILSQGTGGPVLTTSFRDDSSAVNSILINGTHTVAIGVAAGAGYGVIGALARLSASALLEVVGPASAVDPLVQFGQASSAQSYSVVLRTGSAVSRWFMAGASSAFVTGSIAGDAGFAVPSGFAFLIGRAGPGASIITARNNAGASELGFFASTSAAKQTVTGAKGSNAALGSLLTALAAYGLITDSTTA